MRDKSQLLNVREQRAVEASAFEFRAEGDSLSLTGYASVFDHGYDVYGGPSRGGWTEIVDRGAFKKTLAEKPDLHLLINHEGMPLARTKSGTLALSTDSTGLKVKAQLDRADPDVQRLETKMKRGDMDEMSFAFRVMRQEWSNDEEERRLLELSLDKGDVSVVNFGANPATSAKVRSLTQVLDVLAELEPERALAEVRAIEGFDLEQVEASIKALTELRRSLQPAESRTMSVAEALKLIS
jgi:HK97 family phage prohead protease